MKNGMEWRAQSAGGINQSRLKLPEGIASSVISLLRHVLKQDLTLGRTIKWSLAPFLFLFVSETLFAAPRLIIPVTNFYMFWNACHGLPDPLIVAYGFSPDEAAKNFVGPLTACYAAGTPPAIIVTGKYEIPS